MSIPKDIDNPDLAVDIVNNAQKKCQSAYANCLKNSVGKDEMAYPSKKVDAIVFKVKMALLVVASLAMLVNIGVLGKFVVDRISDGIARASSYQEYSDFIDMEVCDVL